MAWSLLRSWLMGHEGQKSGRGRRPVRQRARSTPSGFRPLLEALEDRLAPTVNPVLIGTTLKVTLSASGDKALLFGGSGEGVINVGSRSFKGVQSINITGEKNAAGQKVELDGNMHLTGNLSIDQITEFTLARGRCEIGGNLNITNTTTAVSARNISGTTAFTVTGSTRLSTSGSVRLEGDNDFRGAVRLSAGGTEARLKDVNKLTLAELKVQKDASLTAGDLDFTGNIHEYQSKDKGTLSLHAANPTQTMTIGDTAAGYHLSQNAIKQLRKVFGGLVLGDVAQNNPIIVQGMEYFTDTSIRTGSTITVNGKVHTNSKDAQLVLQASGGTVLNADIDSTNGGDVSLVGPVTLGTPGEIQIHTAVDSGAIHLGQVNDDATPTVLQVEGKKVRFESDVGNVKPVAGVKIKNAGDVKFDGSTKAGFIKQEHGTGVTSLHDMDVTGDGTPLDITTFSVRLRGIVTAAGRTVQLDVTGGITQEADAGLKAAALALKGSGSKFELEGVHNEVATLAADVHGELSFRGLNDLTVGTAGQVKGINTHNYRVSLDAGKSLIIGSGAGEDIDGVDGKVLLKAGNGVREKAGSGIVTKGGLGLRGVGTFDLTQSGNRVRSLAIAKIDGNLDFLASGALTIGLDPKETAIETNGGNVKITTGGILTVEGKVSTKQGGQGAGGKYEVFGKKSNVRLAAHGLIDLGKGNITFVVPG
jgi:hypothetical protein